VDELSRAAGSSNGKYVQLDELEVAMNRLAATTAVHFGLGVPMMNAGQDFLRSKYGVQNTYDKPATPATLLRWTDRDQSLARENSSYYRDLIALRKSDQGRAFRVREKAPAGYYQWITPENTRALGYIVNAPRIHDGHGFVALLNAADQAVEFSFTLPEGRWRVIGDHVKVDLAGLPGREVVNGGQTVKVRVKEMSSLLLMDGF
jgi:pullulanase/glycogen debranching enzyme